MKRESLPGGIRIELSRLEEELKLHLSVLRVYKGRYYVYSSNSKVDKQTGNRIYKVEYVGRISEDGNFIRPKGRSNVSLEDIKALPANVADKVSELKGQGRDIALVSDGEIYHVYERVYGAAPLYLGYISEDGRLTGSGNPEKAQDSDERYSPINMDSTDIAVLRALSMNARMPFKYVGRIAGISAAAAFHRAKRLENEFGIRYIAEANLEALGYSEFICSIKFLDVMPSVDELRSVFAAEPSVQYAAVTKGEFDFIAYMLVRNNDEMATIIYNLKSTVMRRYKSYWHIVPFRSYYGYVPLRDEFFDIVEEDKAWSRSRDNGRLPEGKIFYADYEVMRDLNTNGNAEFVEIESRLGLRKEMAAHAYHSLIEKFKVIRRVTLTMHKTPKKYDAIIFADFIDYDAFLKTRDELMQNIIEDGAFTDKYALIGDLESPYSEMFITPVYTENGLEEAIDGLRRKVRGISIRSVVVVEAVVGRLCYRVFDNAYSIQSETLERNRKITRRKIDYYL